MIHRTPARVRRPARLPLAAAFALMQSATALAGAFVYVDSRAIVTAEFSSAQRATVNLFNLTDFVVVFKAQNLLALNPENVLSIGQVIVQQPTPPENAPYAGFVLLQPWSFAGLEVLGAFTSEKELQQVIVVQGGKRLHLVEAAPGEFEELAARIESLEMKHRDGPAILQRAGIAVRGRVAYPTGEEDGLDEALRKILGPEDTNPPRILERPPAQRTEDAVRAGVTGRVRLSVSLSRFGDIKEVTVVRGLGHGLDERAVAVVRNSWKFLPATRRSEPVDVSMMVEVEFGS